MKLSVLSKTCSSILLGCLLSTSFNANADVHYTQANQLLADNAPVQFIIRLKAELRSLDVETVVKTLSHDANLPLNYIKTMSSGDIVLGLNKTQLNQLSKTDETKSLSNLAKAISKSANVQDVTPDYIFSMQMVPDVSEFDKQWDLYEAAGGINAPDAWDVTTGSSSVVVGIIDTGITDHESFKGSDSQKLVPGYSFVRNSADNHDDGIETGHGKVYHGTHVAGTIGALTGPGQHISGIAPKTRILPVQVLGSDGSGNMSNIIEGMKWAAGLPANGAPSNPNPAQVLNMSLGGQAILGCMLIKPLQEAIDQITAKGTSVVVAAGNGDAQGNPQNVEGTMGFVPASCKGVVTVASVGREGLRAFYSNYGKRVDITAPGGDQHRDRGATEDGIYSTTSPGHYEFYQGTSMASPHVAGVVALMKAVAPGLSATEVTAGLKASARPFPADSSELSCSTSAICGAGILNADQAVKWARKHG
jgi:serine protease